MLPNLYILIASAFIPLLIGYIWYHPRLFGGERWARASGQSIGVVNQGVKPWKMAFTVVLNLLVAFGLYNVVLHQAHIIGMTGGDLEAIKTGVTAEFMHAYGHTHQHFGHGVLHGLAPTLVCFFVPLLGYTVIFESKPIEYFLIRLGYWAINLSLMGGLISACGGVTIL
jgi:hypothetical protein